MLVFGANMKIFLRADNNPLINIEEIAANESYRTSPAKHMNLYRVNPDDYIQSGFLSTFLYDPTKKGTYRGKNRELLPDALVAALEFSEGKKFIHIIVLDDSNLNYFETFNLEGTTKMEEDAGPGIQRVFIDKRNNENNPLETTPVFSKEKAQLFYTKHVTPLLEPGKYKTDSEVLLGGQWYNLIADLINFSHGDFFDFLNQYNSNVRKDKTILEEKKLVTCFNTFKPSLGAIKKPIEDPIVEGPAPKKQKVHHPERLNATANDSLSNNSFFKPGEKKSEQQLRKKTLEDTPSLFTTKLLKK